MTDTLGVGPKLVEQLLVASRTVLDVSKWLQDWNSDALTAALDAYRSPGTREWAILGEVSTGKSTLLNGLLGHDCLPEGNQGTTTVPIHVAAPTQVSAAGTISLEPRSREDLSEMLRWLLVDHLRLSTSSESLTDVAEQWLADSAAVGKSAEAVVMEKLLVCLSREVTQSAAPVRAELGCLDDLLPLDPLVWRRAVVFLDSPWAELGVEWVDLPGLGHPNPLHRWMTEQALASAQRAFLLVEPRGATEVTLDVLAGLDARARAMTMLVFSRIDETAAHGEDWEAATAKVLEQIGWEGSWTAVSARCARAARAAMGLSPGQRELRNLERAAFQHEPLSPGANLQLSGMPALESMLRNSASESAAVPLLRLITGLYAALPGLERALEQRHDRRRSAVLDRYRQAVDRSIEKALARKEGLVKSLRNGIREILSEERAGFAQLDRRLEDSERRQRIWAQLLSWNIEQKIAVGNVLKGLGDDFASGMRVLINALWVPYGPQSAHTARHARDLVNLGRLAATMDPLDQLYKSDFFKSRKHWLSGLRPLGRWACRLGFPQLLRREALSYVAELGRARAAKERLFLKQQYGDQGLGRWRTPIRTELAARRRNSQSAFARLVAGDAVTGIHALSEFARDDLVALKGVGTSIVNESDTEDERQLRSSIGELRAYLGIAKSLLIED